MSGHPSVAVFYLILLIAGLDFIQLFPADKTSVTLASEDSGDSTLTSACSLCGVTHRLLKSDSEENYTACWPCLRLSKSQLIWKWQMRVECVGQVQFYITLILHQVLY